MIDREKLAAFINNQLFERGSDEFYIKKQTYCHYGSLELRDLMDKIYGCEPTTEEEFIKGGFKC